MGFVAQPITRAVREDCWDKDSSKRANGANGANGIFATSTLPAVGRILSGARRSLHVLHYSPKTVSVRAHQSPYIGDEDALTESALAFSVCSSAPSQNARYRAS